MTAEQAFERVVTELAAEPGVTLGKAFHNPGLKPDARKWTSYSQEALSFGRELAP